MIRSSKINISCLSLCSSSISMINCVFKLVINAVVLGFETISVEGMFA